MNPQEVTTEGARWAAQGRVERGAGWRHRNQGSHS